MRASFALFGTLVLALSWGRPGASSAEEAPARASRARGEGPRVEIEVVGAKAWRNSNVLLSARLVPPAAAEFRWVASDGVIDRSNRRVASWTTPDRRGKVEIRCEATLLARPDAPPVLGSIEVDLAEPSTAAHVRIPGGIYTIGDTWTDTSADDFILTNQNKADKPAHRVRLRPFYIRRDRVTNEEYARFLQEIVDLGVAEVTDWAVLGPHRGGLVPYFRWSWEDLPETKRNVPKLRGAIRYTGKSFEVRPGEERHPVVDVTWVGSDAYARFHGLRLPTNAEWEAAARGRDGRKFPWGDDLPTPRHAQVNDWHGTRLFPVGTFSPLGDSPFGVREMIGGVVEWVHDWYNESYYEDIARDAPVDNPRGPHWGKDHVFRGADFSFTIVGNHHEQPAISFRYAWFFDFAIGEGIASWDTGFRTACDDYGWRAEHEEDAPSGGAASDPSSDAASERPTESGNDGAGDPGDREVATRTIETP